MSDEEKENEKEIATEKRDKDRRNEVNSFFTLLHRINILEVVAIIFLSGMVWQQFAVVKEKQDTTAKEVSEVSSKVTEIKVNIEEHKQRFTGHDERIKYLERK